ncbi:UNVERIFIED_ORG: outer membrane biosynthesis protein TonB [Paraburkholderia sediminicola]|nr:outer membrane biosynthesis protein TonB [Paraburkholderia sediminicola]
MSSPSTAQRSDRTPPVGPRAGLRVGRWLAVLLAVAVLHWIAAQWVERNRASLNPSDNEHVPVQVALLTPERVERKPATDAQQAATPAPAHKAVASKPREHVLTATQPAKQAPAVAAASDAAASASAAASQPDTNAKAGATAAGTASAPAAASAPHAAAGVKFSVPPSGELQYDTFYNGVRNQPGTIHWTSNAQSYDMVVSVPLPFVGTFVYSSHGRIDAFGLAPDQYIEKRGRRPEDVAIFNRTDKNIAFTRTPTTLPLPDGAQDRFSMVMQLASLVRGDPAAYKPGVTRQFFVVDNNSGENWPVETIGDETIRTAQGYLETRHFKRLPRHDGDLRRIDVWLAPSLGWLPARIMQTEPNGTQFELVWRGKLNADGTGSSVDSTSGSNGTSGAGNTSPDNSANQPPGNSPAPTPETTPSVDTTVPGNAPEKP